MSRPTPAQSPVVAGLLAVLALGGAACESETTPACDGDECDMIESPAEESKGDAGKSKPDASVRRDAGETAPVPSARKGIPCDVKPLVETYCGSCHGASPKFGAPMALATAEDFQASSGGKSMSTVVETRLNETDPRKAMPPTSSKQPTAAEKALINAWLAKGAPAGDSSCESNQPDAGIKPDSGTINGPSDEELDCYKFTAHSGDFKSPYKVGVANDAYFNFVFKAPWKGTAYGIVIRPIIDNDKVIHHWLLFQDDAPGTAKGAVKSTGAHPSGQLLHGWAPGGDPMDFRTAPDDVGLELPGDNQTYTMEFHYNSSDATATDTSGVEVCVHHKKPANIAGLSWLGNDNLLFPSAKWTGVCKPTSTQPIHIVGVSPHMHKQGTHMKGTITRANGTKEVLHDEPFDFNYQRSYMKNDVVLQPGDSITTECTYAQPMAFGESTTAEMCYLFTMAYPKGALASPDLWGKFAHGGSSCLGQ